MLEYTVKSLLIVILCAAYAVVMMALNVPLFLACISAAVVCGVVGIRIWQWEGMG